MHCLTDKGRGCEGKALNVAYRMEKVCQPFETIALNEITHIMREKCCVNEFLEAGLVKAFVLIDRVPSPWL